jgi:hypothetical protein
VVTKDRPRSPEPDPVGGFFDTIRGAIFTSIPALAALVFVIVSVKVFRASRMETTTTVAIVSNADDFQLLKGIVLTLLPGFLAGLTAAAIWWWAAVLPERLEGPQARATAERALFSPQAVWAWAMIVMAFFTIWWPVFLVLFVPVLAATGALIPVALGASGVSPRTAAVVRGVVAVAVVALIVAAVVDAISWASLVIVLVPIVVVPESVLFGLRPRARATVPLRRTLKVFALVAASVFIGLLTLAPTVWLPLRTVTFNGPPPTLKDGQLPREVAAYVLSSDDKGSSLLLDNPRAVVDVTRAQVERKMPLCVPPESKLRVLTTRASQVLGIDEDPHSPYETCPQIEQRLLGGG